MLDRWFVETPDYRTLIETSDRTIVAGRHGTGKSALARAARGSDGAAGGLPMKRGSHRRRHAHETMTEVVPD
jgi:ABC-type transport system involved in cytochrome c biogenesis ATPase subunit